MDRGEPRRQARETTEAFHRIPLPEREWPGPMGDPLLVSWQEVDPLLMCGLAVLNEHHGGDDLLADEEIRMTITAAATSQHELLRRPSVPLARRLGF
jgi:hypothetical protein